MTTLETVDDALALLRQLGAPRRLLVHHQLVAEVAAALVVRLGELFGLEVDQRRVTLGASLHDAGKILHPAELEGPGHEHQGAGEALLIPSPTPTQRHKEGILSFAFIGVCVGRFWCGASTSE